MYISATILFAKVW